MKRIFVFVLIGLTCHFGLAQNFGNSLLENLTEILSENSEEEPDVEELAEIWQFFLDNPININSECTDDLRKLVFLSEFQIQEIIDFKNEKGPILSIYELATVNDFSRDLLENLEPFLYFGEAEKASAFSGFVKRELFFRTQRVVEKANGYINGASYLGAPQKYYMRFKQSGDRLNFGFTAEKDPGEPFFRKPNSKGFDYYSAFANYEIERGKYKIYAGDFLARAGQGLVIWQGFASGKSTQVNNIYRSNAGIRSYTSADENRFLRGVAGEINFRNASLFVFHSEKKIDANIIVVDEKNVFSSFQTSGLHRTVGEIADKHSVKENVTGLLFSFQRENFLLGFSAVHTYFDKPKVSDGQAYKLFLFEGNEISNVGINYKWSFNRIFLFGETAYSFDGGLANLHGAMLKLADRLELSTLYRNFGIKYNCLYGQAFSESSAINDEQGFYVGAKFFPLAKIVISAYYDFFKYQWLKYKTASPALGSESFFQIDYAPNSNTQLYLRYFQELKESKYSEGQINTNTISLLKRTRVNMNIDINEQWSLGSRVEFSVFSNTEKENGLLLFQDLKYKASRLPFSCQLRFAWFDAQSYNCRFYAYENDLLYNFSIPSLSGKGVRTYLNGKYSLSQSLDLWFKLGRTQYFDQQSIGTGLDEIKGDRKTEIKFQLRYRF